MLKKLSHPAVLLTLTAMFWAGNAIIGKIAVGNVSPMVLTFLRWAIALIVIAIVARHNITKDWPVMRANLPYLLIMGSVGYGLFNFALYTALHYTSPINATIEQTAMPLFIFLLSYLLYRTPIRAVQILGYSLTVVGVIITASYGEPWKLFAEADALNRGDALILLAGVFYSGYSVGLKRKPDIHWQSLLAAFIFGGLLVGFVGVLWETWLGTVQWPVTRADYAVVVYAGLFPSLASQGFYIIGATALGANRAGLFINLVPVFAALFAVLLLGEELHLYHAIAFALVAGGVLLAQREGLASTK